MSGLSVSAQTAMSYIDDVKQARERLKREENCLVAEKYGLELISSGDLQLARREAENANESEKRLILSSCYFQEGLIYDTINQGLSKFSSMPEYRQKMRSYESNAAEAFQRSIDQLPTPEAYYNLGLSCLMLDRKYQAVQMLEKAAEGDDPHIAIEARKEIGRIGPVSPPSPTSSAASDSTSEVRFERKKSPDAMKILKGIAITIVGIPLIGVLIGIAMVPYGLWLIYDGYANGIDV